MPTKKKRVGFIPRTDVLDLINKLSYKNNLSYSKIINILVEEALYKRGLFNTKKEMINEKKDSYKKYNDNNAYHNNIKKNKLLKEGNYSFEELNEEPFDNEIYAKFLMFLKFQERMKNSNM